MHALGSVAGLCRCGGVCVALVPAAGQIQRNPRVNHAPALSATFLQPRCMQGSSSA